MTPPIQTRRAQLKIYNQNAMNIVINSNTNA